MEGILDESPRSERVETTQLVDVQGPGDKHSGGALTIEHLATKQRLIRTAWRTACWLGVTVVSAGIPIFHLVLVPTFIMVTITMAFKSFNVRSIITSGKLECPNCQAAVRILPRPNALPFTDCCEECHRELKLSELNV